MKGIYKLLVCIAIMLICIVMVGTFEKKKGESVGNVEMIHCNEEEIEIYDKTTFINGKQVSLGLDIISYQNQIFLSIEILQKFISNYFITENEPFYIRRQQVKDYSSWIKCGETIYIPLDYLENFIHINSDTFSNTGNLCIDSMLPMSFNYKGERFYLNNEEAELSSEEMKLPHAFTSEGRGLWEDNDCVLIEDDWNRVYVYEKSNITLS